jgi:hypothetical protein
MIPHPTIVALHKLPSVVPPTAYAKDLLSVTVGNGLYVYPSSCGNRMDRLLGEQGHTR